jgi:hypothetical protein
MSSIDGILNIIDDNRFAIALSDAINSLPTAFGELTLGEQTAFCVDELEREVNNGGFEQFFLNSSGDYAQPVVDALRRIGAAQAAELVEEAILPIGATGPAADRAKRTAQMKSLGTSARDRWTTLTRAFLQVSGQPRRITSTIRSGEQNRVPRPTGRATRQRIEIDSWTAGLANSALFS